MEKAARKLLSSSLKKGVRTEPYGLKEFGAVVNAGRNSERIGGTAGGERDAYEKGFKAGEEAGYAFGEQKAKLVVERIKGVLEELSNFRDKVLDNLEPEVVDLAFDVARKVLHSEIQTNRDVVVNIAREALKSVGNWKEINIRVSPLDYQYLMESGNDFAEMSRTVTFEPDESIQPGGCLIQEDYGEIDGRIDEQLNEIYDEVTKK